MMRILLTLGVLLCTVGNMQGEWLEFNAGCSDGSEPVVRHGQTTERFITFDVELRGLKSESVSHNQDTYLRFNGTRGVRMATEVGYPEIPVVTCFVAVPDNVSLTVSGCRSCADFLDDVSVYPVPSQELTSESGITFYKEVFQRSATAYASTEWYPEAIAELSGEFRLRDQRIAIVDVYPVQYLASEDSLRVWSDVEVLLQFSESSPIISASDLGPYEGLVRDKIIGYTPDPQPIGTPSPGSVYRPTDLTVAPPETPDYVIIVAGGLDGTWIDNFANYRAQLNGFDVLIAKTDDIFWQFRTYEMVLDPDLIRDYLETLWEFCSPGDRPSYLLLVGDHEDGSCTTIGPWFLPTFIESYHEYANDEWFVYFDEPREVPASFPDMIVGRLSVRDTETLQDMLDLIEEYEAPVIGQGPANLQYRRYLTRLAGTDHQGSMSSDDWKPSVQWTEALKNWLGYEWDNYYCGDGEDTWETLPPNPDGSRMTSADWVNACNTVFNRGSQVAFYSDHGDFHMFSAGLNMRPPAPDNFGVPDSTFDDDDVLALGSFPDHWHPFIMMLCCTAGSFDHTQFDHYNSGVYASLCYEPTDGLPPYDFQSDCLAEDFIRNTEGGAIGVFASSKASAIPYFRAIGESILESIYYFGVTRQGDAIAAGRLACLNEYWCSGGYFEKGLGQFNLLGDPALDLGDRVKYRNCCDLIISPADLEKNLYPTNPLGEAGVIGFQITVRNAGAVASGAFKIDLNVEWNETQYLLTEECVNGLLPGEEETIQFRWTIPTGFEEGDMVFLTATADPEKVSADSWWPNNSASSTIRIAGTFPNEDNWPLELPGSVKCPPMLADIDGDGDLEIVAISGIEIMAFDEETTQVLWRTGPYNFLSSTGGEGYTVMAIGDVCDDGHQEIIVDTDEELLVLAASTGSVLYSYPHGMQQGNATRAPHGVTVANVFPERGKAEIAFVCPENSGDPLSLFILTIERDMLIAVDQEELPQANQSSTREWVSAANITQDSSAELILSFSWSLSGSVSSGIWIYDYDESTMQSGFVDSYTQSEAAITAGIQATGDIAGNPDQIAWSRQRTGADGQAWVFDSDDLSTHDSCAQPTNPSNYIRCCVLADWDDLVPGLDRIIAPAENQCMAWNQIGDIAGNWDAEYGLTSASSIVPMPALANLVSEPGYQTSEVIVGTKDGWINAFNANHIEVDALGFPYQLPSEVIGGYVAADIDQDGKLELVFGTMDNYLHVWELGSCPVGYAPWPMTQHDAMRTGALQN